MLEIYTNYYKCWYFFTALQKTKNISQSFRNIKLSRFFSEQFETKDINYNKYMYMINEHNIM